MHSKSPNYGIWDIDWEDEREAADSSGFAYEKRKPTLYDSLQEDLGYGVHIEDIADEEFDDE